MSLAVELEQVLIAWQLLAIACLFLLRSLEQFTL